MTADRRRGEPGPPGAAGRTVPTTADPPPVGEVAECHGDVCVTCSDSAVPMTVLRLLDGGLACVDTGSGEAEVSVALVPASVGDTVLVHAGEAIAVLGGEQP